VLHVAELARRYEAGGGISFRGFIDELRNAALSTEAAERRFWKKAVTASG
jgi:hypothetical protein